MAGDNFLDRAWGAVDTEDPRTALVSRDPAPDRQPPWQQGRRLIALAVPLLAFFALLCTLGYARSKAARGTKSDGASALEGLSVIGNGYLKLAKTECWLRDRIGESKLGVGPNACQSGCDFDKRCMAFEMYHGNKHCMLLADCKGWAASSPDVYVMVKEPGYFGLSVPMMKLPAGVHPQDQLPPPSPTEPSMARPPERKPAPAVRRPVTTAKPAGFEEAKAMPSVAGRAKQSSVLGAVHLLVKKPPLPLKGIAAVQEEAASHPVMHKVPFTPDMYGKVLDVPQTAVARTATWPSGHKEAGDHEGPEERIVSFYVYRAQSSSDYPIENVNVADLPGVLWYLQEEVVTLCPRKYNISRVLRLKFSAKLTEHRSFIPFVAFDSGKCTVPSCGSLWERIGYKVGCQSTGTGGCYGSEHGHWFSLPGPCPGSVVGRKGQECRRTEPGGRCRSLAELRAPGGNCSYFAESDAEIPLDKLTGISDYAAFCASGSLEYDKATDRGRGLSFWDGSRNRSKADWRLQQARRYLRNAYPHLPEALGDDQPRCTYVGEGRACQ